MIDQLVEKYLGVVKEPWKKKNKVGDVFINPDRKELKEISYDNNDYFAIIIPNNKDVIAFSRDMLHRSVLDQLKISDKKIVAATCAMNGRELYVNVTDATKNSEWFHNPDIGYWIEDNKYLSRKWSSFDINFFDEAIYGDWRDMDED